MNSRDIKRKELKTTSAKTVPIIENKYIYNFDSNIPYLFSIEGPILFSAPHSMPLDRIDFEEGKRTCIHKREMIAAEIALKCANELKEKLGCHGSLAIWDPRAKKSSKNLDPNYLWKQQFDKSPFHRFIHYWANHNLNLSKPLFHIDIHGKMNRKNNRYIDVGILTTLELWSNGKDASSKAKFVKDFSSSIKTHLSKACDGINVDGMKVSPDMDPNLHGYWGDDWAHTMQHQSCLMGIPSLQLEIPLSVRKLLRDNQEFRSSFIQSIVNVYNEVVVKHWELNQMQSKVKIKYEYLEKDKVYTLSDEEYNAWSEFMNKFKYGSEKMI